MFGIIKGLTKVAISPLRGIKEVVDDVSGKNGDGNQAGAILTTGISSILKGTAKGISDGVDDIFTN